jgi:hypothetical protein
MLKRLLAASASALAVLAAADAKALPPLGSLIVVQGGGASNLTIVDTQNSPAQVGDTLTLSVVIPTGATCAWIRGASTVVSTSCISYTTVAGDAQQTIYFQVKVNGVLITSNGVLLGPIYDTFQGTAGTINTRTTTQGATWTINGGSGTNTGALQIGSSGGLIGAEGTTPYLSWGFVPGPSSGPAWVSRTLSATAVSGLESNAGAGRQAAGDFITPPSTQVDQWSMVSLDIGGASAALPAYSTIISTVFRNTVSGYSSAGTAYTYSGTATYNNGFITETGATTGMLTYGQYIGGSTYITGYGNGGGSGTTGTFYTSGSTVSGSVSSITATANNLTVLPGDTVSERYYNDNGNLLEDIYLNGAPVQYGIPVSAFLTTFGNGFGVRGDAGGSTAGSSILSSMKVTNPSTQADITVYWPWRVQPMDMSGGTTFKFIGDYSNQAPASLTYTVYDAVTNAVVLGPTAISNFTTSTTSYDLNLGANPASVSTGSYFGKSAYITSGTLPQTDGFYVKVCRTDVTGNNPCAQSPILHLGFTFMTNGQSLAELSWVNSGINLPAYQDPRPLAHTAYYSDSSTSVGGSDAAVPVEWASRYSTITDLSTRIGQLETWAVTENLLFGNAYAAFGRNGIGSTTAWLRQPRTMSNSWAGSSMESSFTMNVSGTTTGWGPPQVGQWCEGTNQTGVQAETQITGGSGTSFTVTSAVPGPVYIAYCGPSQAYQAFQNGIDRIGGYATGINDVGGHYDAKSTSGNGSLADYEANMELIYSSIGAYAGFSPKVVVIPLGAVKNPSTSQVPDANANRMRQIQFNLQTDNPGEFYYGGGNTADLQHNGSDNWHLISVAFGEQNRRATYIDGDILGAVNCAANACKRGMNILTVAQSDDGTNAYLAVTFSAPNATSVDTPNANATGVQYGYDMGMNFGIINSGTITTAIGTLHSTAVSCQTPSGGQVICTWSFPHNTFNGVHGIVTGPIGHNPYNPGDNANVECSGLPYDTGAPATNRPCTSSTTLWPSTGGGDYWKEGAAILRAHYAKANFIGTITSGSLTVNTLNSGTVNIGDWVRVPGSSPATECQIISGSGPYTLTAGCPISATSVSMESGEPGVPVQYYLTTAGASAGADSDYVVSQ